MHINLFNDARSMAIAGTALTTSLLISKNWTNNHLFQNVTGMALLFIGYKITQQVKKPLNFTVEHPIERKSVKKGKKVQVQHIKETPKYRQWGLRAVGIAFVCYGAYTVASNVLGFNSSQTMNVVGYTSSQTIDEVKQEFFNCPPLKAIWDNTLKQGSFVVRYEQNSELKAFNGRTSYAPNREIVLKKNQSYLWITMLAELLNLRRQDEALTIPINMCYLSANDFARKNELYEYKNVFDAYELVSECVKNYNWPPERKDLLASRFETVWRTLKDYLQWQEARGHTQLYRDAWYKACGG